MVLVTECPREGADAAAVRNDLSCVHEAYTSMYAYDPQVECVHLFGDKAYVPENETVGEALTRLRERAGLSVRALAIAAGYSHGSGVQRFLEPSYSKPLSPSIAQNFMNALAGKGTPPIQPEEIQRLTGLPVPPNGTPAPPMEGPGFRRMHRDVPIYGTALGAAELIAGEAIEQTMLNTGDVVGYARRPVILEGRADVYALYVQGSSMHPRFRDGAIVFVETKRQPSIGDDCVIYLRIPDLHDGERVASVLIKTLVRKTSSYVELEQYSPSLTFKVERERVAQMHRVIPWDELVS